MPCEKRNASRIFLLSKALVPTRTVKSPSEISAFLKLLKFSNRRLFSIAILSSIFIWIDTEIDMETISIPVSIQLFYVIPKIAVL